jgi:hypothetical protein
MVVKKSNPARAFGTLCKPPECCLELRNLPPFMQGGGCNPLAPLLKYLVYLGYLSELTKPRVISGKPIDVPYN